MDKSGSVQISVNLLAIFCDSRAMTHESSNDCLNNEKFLINKNGWFTSKCFQKNNF